MSNSIKHWNSDDRPREKAIEKGISALSDTELLAILIGGGTVGKSALDLAKEIYAAKGKSFSLLSRVSIKELATLAKGIGPAKAVSIAAALEIGNRRQKEMAVNVELKNSGALRDLLLPYFYNHASEAFYIVFLKRNTLIAVEQVSTGGLTATLVDVRVIFKQALLHQATAIAIAHNHPSGNPSPSAQDQAVTERVKHAGRMLDINLVDHLIITHSGEYYSFADNGAL